MTNISALLHFLVWIEIQKYHFRCVPTLVDLWVYLVDVWSSHIWWPFANGLVSQMSRHLHCFNARVVPEELSNRRMVPLSRFLFSCVFFQPEFVGPFFHHVREGVPYQSYPKSRVQKSDIFPQKAMPERTHSFFRATEVLQLFRIDILLFSAVKTVGWCSFSQTKFI